MSKTVRRDKLLRLAKAGKLVATGGYSYDDMYGESRWTGQMPVNILVSGDHSGSHRHGYYNMLEFDFKAQGGRASLNEDGSIWLYVHSNCNHDLRIVDTPAPEVVEVNHWTGDTRYKLVFPLPELGNAIALCGWTLCNALVKTPAVRSELARLEALDSLDIPDGKEWFEKYAIRAA